MPATDKFKQYADDLETPFTNGADVTPDDDADLDYISRGVYVGTSGAVQITWEGGNTQVLPNLVAGVWHPMRVRRIHAASTTASDIKIAW